MLKTIGSRVIFAFVAMLTFGAQAQAAIDCSTEVGAVASDTAAAAAAIEAGGDCAVAILAELAVIDADLAASTVIIIIGTNPEVVEAAVLQLGALAKDMIVAVAETADARTIVSVLSAVDSAGLDGAVLTSIDVAVEGAIASREDLSDEDISSITAVIVDTVAFTAPASSSPS